MKICNNCKKEKENILFHKDKSKKDGLCTFCKECRNSKPFEVVKNCIICNNKFSSFFKNKHSLLCSETCKKIRNINNKKIYDSNNRNKINNYVRFYKKDRKEKDLIYRFSLSLRERIRNIFKISNISKQNNTINIIGCSFEEFKNYIELKLSPWMNIENYGKYNGEYNYGWDLDHIIPLSSAKTEEELIKLCHYTNLQPLCSKINRKDKKDKTSFDAIPEYKNL
jgi:hypothetical protein